MDSIQLYVCHPTKKNKKTHAFHCKSLSLTCHAFPLQIADTHALGTSWKINQCVGEERCLNKPWTDRQYKPWTVCEQTDRRTGRQTTDGQTD